MCGLLAAALTRTSLLLPRVHVPLVVVAGACGAAGTTLFLLAADVGPVGTAAVLAETSPVLTALLAWPVLGERLRAVHLVGLTCAAAAAVLLGRAA